MKILITGGTGFIGRYLVKNLNKKYPNSNILILIRKSFKDNIKKEYDGNKNIEFVYDMDISKYDEIEPYFENIDYVFHLAATKKTSKKFSKEIFETNVIGTKNVIGASIKHKVKRIIYTRSTRILDGKNKILNEKNIALEENLKNYPYALSKLYAQRIIAKYSKQIIINTAIPSWVLGATNKDTPLLKFSKSFPYISPPGSTAIIDVRDLAEGLVLLMESKKIGSFIFSGSSLKYTNLIYKLSKKRSRGFVLPMCSKKAATYFSQIYSSVFRNTNITPEVISILYEEKEYSSQKANKELNWYPKYSLNQTIKNLRFKVNH
ncbi:NAD-dependent epimerase/dehydratase family protein [archaeon]|nr:NAD-dependent epimerase/dehydratase family protein [archaeon]